MKKRVQKEFEQKEKEEKLKLIRKRFESSKNNESLPKGKISSYSEFKSKMDALKTESKPSSQKLKREMNKSFFRNLIYSTNFNVFSINLNKN